MLGRVGYALAIGILLGIIASGSGLYAATRHGAAAPEARGDANAPFELAFTISEAFFTDQLNHPRPAQAGEPAPSQSQLRDAAIRLRADGRIEVQGKVPVFGVTVPVVQMAGGLVVAALGFRLRSWQAALAAYFTAQP